MGNTVTLPVTQRQRTGGLGHVKSAGPPSARHKSPKDKLHANCLMAALTATSCLIAAKHSNGAI